MFHSAVDTNNITESFNNVLRRRYLPLRHDTTIFALVQILVEVVFPEQEVRYIQATIKQMKAYRRPRYELPDFLTEKPHTVQSICLLNIERAKALPKNHITEQEPGIFTFLSCSSGPEDSWMVNIPSGTCTCPSFVSSHIPCKHMFAVFHHNSNWSWYNLPKEPKSSSHMTLDHQAATQVESREFSSDAEMGGDDMYALSTTEPGSPLSVTSITSQLPKKITMGKQIYRLQKNVEEALGQCRTLAFLTNDIPTPENALEQCTDIMQMLASSVSTSVGPTLPPIFHSIAKAGVQDFKHTTKAMHRVGIKRKHRVKQQQVNKTTKPRTHEQDPVSHVVKHQPGRPRLKRSQRKKPPLPRQVSSPNKHRMLKAAAILRRG